MSRALSRGFGRVMRLGSIAALASVPFVSYVLVGRQPYAPWAFAERVSALSTVRLIDSSWAVPPLLGLASAAIAVLSLVLPRRLRTFVFSCGAVLALASALISFKLTSSSSLVSAGLGQFLLLLGGIAAFASISAERLK